MTTHEGRAPLLAIERLACLAGRGSWSIDNLPSSRKIARRKSWQPSRWVPHPSGKGGEFNARTLDAARPAQTRSASDRRGITPLDIAGALGAAVASGNITRWESDCAYVVATVDHSRRGTVMAGLGAATMRRLRTSIKPRDVAGTLKALDLAYTCAVDGLKVREALAMWGQTLGISVRLGDTVVYAGYAAILNAADSAAAEALDHL